MKIEVKRPAREELENQGVFDWPKPAPDGCKKTKGPGAL